MEKPSVWCGPISLSFSHSGSDGSRVEQINPSSGIVSSDIPIIDWLKISKESHIRPARRKAFCPHCDTYKDGFHSKHELQRHIDRIHKNTRKVWICVDSSTTKEFLANCKACRSKKTYLSSYEAAAHLRRLHFNPAKRGRRGRDEGSERRGGKSSGQYHSIETLKKWMAESVETVLVVGGSSAAVSEEEIAESERDDLYLPAHTPRGNEPSHSLLSPDTALQSSDFSQPSNNMPQPNTSFDSKDGNQHDTDLTSYQLEGSQRASRYACPIPGCSSYFTRRANLNRHDRTCYGLPKMIDCPKKACSRKGENGFKRKDHFVEHLRGYHNATYL